MQINENLFSAFWFFRSGVSYGYIMLFGAAAILVFSILFGSRVVYRWSGLFCWIIGILIIIESIRYFTEFLPSISSFHSSTASQAWDFIRHMEMRFFAFALALLFRLVSKRRMNAPNKQRPA